jgi:hypothetical protein
VQSVKHWPNLPEDYGDGQRQFDMAKAAYDAVEPVAWLAAGSIFYLFWSFFPWFIAIPLGPIALLVLIIPHKRRLKEARKAWTDDIEAYQEYLKRPLS